MRNTDTMLYAIFVPIVLLLGGLSVAMTLGSKATLTSVVVKDGERVCSSATDCKYLEFFEDETFENTDTMLFGKFNSSDVHRNIREGMTCELNVVGHRIPFLSQYRNIISANCR